jgi:CheY-specific phosphatase CheX
VHYISEFIRAATSDIYTGMVNLTTEAVNNDDAAMPAVNPKGVTASVKFDGGLDAWLHMTYSDELARNVTYTMMGSMPANSAASEVGDVIGELANMIGGGFKTKMAGKGFAGNASAPQITPNASFSPQPIAGGVAIFNLIKVPAANGELEIRIFAKV